MTDDDKRRPYAPQDQFALERDFRGNPLMAAVKLARYKFPARLIAPEDRVLDLGCGNGYGAYFYATVAREVIGLDLHADLEGAAERGLARDNLTLVKGDILDLPSEVAGATFDVVVAVDVIEHFYRDDGERIVADYSERLSDRGMMILGTPNRGSGAYRSEASRRVHMHEYEPEELRTLCDRHFKRTLLFSMNDEVVHTGFAKMAWFFYVLAFK